MIIKGNPAGSVGFWSSHLLRDDTNERVTVKEIRGLSADTLPAALREMQAVAAGSRSQGNFMYAANINPGPGETLTPEQWAEAWDTLEKNLGLEDHQRVIVEHEKKDEDGVLRTHQHAVWNRVDVDTMKVADMGGNYRVHTATARELEARLDLAPNPTPDPAMPHPKALELWEIRAAERSGIAPQDVKAEVTALWQQTDSGQDFAAALDERGYMLAKGDRRDFCVIDQAGDAHSLARRLDGVKAAEVRERMADIDRDSLPTVAEAKDIQRGRIEERAEIVAQLHEANQADNSSLRAAEDKAFWSGVQERRDDRAQIVQESWQEKRKAEASKIDAVDVADTAKQAGLYVIDAASGIADSLVSFITGPAKKAPQPAPGDYTPAQQQVLEIRAQKRATAALESIRDDIEAGRGLKSDDVMKLTPNHIDNIRAKGDAYLMELIESMERRQALERDYGRGRER